MCSRFIVITLLRLEKESWLVHTQPCSLLFKTSCFLITAFRKRPLDLKKVNVLNGFSGDGDNVFCCWKWWWCLLHPNRVTAIRSRLFNSGFLSSDRWMEHYLNRLAFKNNWRALNSRKAAAFNDIQQRWSSEMKFCCKKVEKPLWFWHEGEKKKCGLSQAIENTVTRGVFQHSWPPWQQQTLMWLSESSPGKEKREYNLKRRNWTLAVKTNNLYIKKTIDTNQC